MVDMKAFFGLTYGLYIVSAQHEGKTAGCVVNTLAQITVEPAQMTVVVHKDNYTAQLMQKSGCFAGVVLAKDCSMELIAGFGFRSSRDTDKFAGLATQVDENGVPYLTEQVVARYSCKIINQIDAGTHIIFVGEATTAETLSTEEPLDYTYYHRVKKGQTPPKASSYKPEEEKKGYRCKVCGYIYEGEPLPPDFICPICKKGAEFFEKL